MSSNGAKGRGAAGRPSRDAVGELGALRGAEARRWRVAVIDGPNMPNLGARDEGIYGKVACLADLQAFVAEVAAAVGVEVEPFASNHEGEILEFIHSSAERVDGYLINPAGLTFPGEATRHALVDSRRPYIEVHFSTSLATSPPSTPPLSSAPASPTRRRACRWACASTATPEPCSASPSPSTTKPSSRAAPTPTPQATHDRPQRQPQWNPNVTPADVAEVATALDGLARLDGVESLLHGENLGLNPATAATCDYAFTVRLTDEESFAAYLAHPTT